ncbi:transcription factor BIM3-like [Mangifera indica]|uniref:transcription factor BIM3-like n=1 Tax=Mangifera indica TaxID=29780 RepID=UPI001CF9C8A8|nr:transcription factor BIM3-like [Mangifera indica]
MVKSSNPRLEEDEEADLDEELLHGNTPSSAYKGEEMKVEGKSSEQKTNAHRSKHSETEQRRRSKINERFQTLRDLIPQNDQKRDKASFLLEVIEYIQFLRDKLNMYEGSYQGWSQEPTKLIPWRNQNGPAESYMEHAQVLKNGSSHENNIVTPAMLTNAQNSMESDMGTSAVYKATDFAPGSASPMVPFNVHAQPNMYAPVGRGTMPTQSLQESISDAENMSYQHQSQFWPGRACATDCAILNGSLNEQDLLIESGSSSISSAYSQGVLNTLTQALQSSGVDLSQANISVQIDVRKSVVSGQTVMASSSKDQEKQYQDNLVMAQTEVQSFDEDSVLVRKRLRTE